MYTKSECPSCGAPINLAQGQSLGSFKCQYCGKSFQTDKKEIYKTNESRVLFQADFNDPNLTGWEKVNPNNVSILNGAKPELQAKFPPSERVHFVLKTSGYLDDQDMRLKIRFLEGNSEKIHAGCCARYEDGIGGYCVLISPVRTYIFGVYETPAGGAMVWRSIIAWRYHSALKVGMQETNELRFLLKGTQLSLYFNGVLATTFKDTQYSKGQSHLAVEPSDQSSLKAAFSDVILYEA